MIQGYVAMSNDYTNGDLNRVSNKLVILYRLEPGCLGPDGILSYSPKSFAIT